MIETKPIPCLKILSLWRFSLNNEEEIIILGANGQLGRALKEKYPKAKTTDLAELDITNIDSMNTFAWSKYKIVLNAAAYTNVDGAETNEGRIAAWKVNATAVSYLVEACAKHNLTLVHVSTDYVFDGTNNLHKEDEVFSPLSVYGASKAAGDIVVSTLKSHYILRTSWVIGEGKNFVRTMLEIGSRGINPTVVNDQVGRLTFTNELVRAIDHLLKNNAPFGVYNVSNDGEPNSWADITRKIFALAKLTNSVSEISTADYFKGKDFVAPRPQNSALDLSKIKQIGFCPIEWETDLKTYIDKELGK